MLTQKYKQQQQQVRVQTSESNYAKGMFFSDVPLTEGYSKILVNWEIDPITGKLTPRKGLKTVLSWGNIASSYNKGFTGKYHNLNAYRVTVPNSYNTNKHLLAVFHDVDSREGLFIDSDMSTANVFSKLRLIDEIYKGSPNVNIPKSTHDTSEYVP